MEVQNSKIKMQKYLAKLDPAPQDKLKFKILKTFYFWIAILPFAFLLLPFSQARAASIDLGISPPILQIEALPPASIKAPIAIQNFGEETIELDIFFKPFTASDKENGEVAYPEPNQPLNGINPLIFQNMQIFENEHVTKNITLAPEQQKSLTLHIGIGKNEPIGDYYFSVVFISKPIEGDQVTQSVATAGITTNVLLTIGPKGKAKGAIEEFSAPFFLEKGPVPFTVRVKNEGKHVIAPQGVILIKNMFGQTVGKVDLLPVNILSNSIRAIPDSLQSPDATPPAALNFELLTLNSPKAYWPESFLLGPYTAKLTVSLSDQGPILTRTIRFFAFPAYAIFGFILAIGIVIFIAKRVKSKLR